MTRRYLGSWTLPSGNSCNIYLATSVDHWLAVTFTAILRAVADVTGQRVLGVTR
jgi:hypothetical protein